MRQLSVEEIQQALDLRKDGWSRVWNYQASHSWFELCVVSPKFAGNFHLFCGACTRIECDISWMPLYIQIEKVGNDYIVKDGAHLFVKCGLFVGKYNVPPIFHNDIQKV
jgi:hypothetical protein